MKNITRIRWGVKKNLSEAVLIKQNYSPHGGNADYQEYQQANENDKTSYVITLKDGSKLQIFNPEEVFYTEEL